MLDIVDPVAAFCGDASMGSAMASSRLPFNPGTDPRSAGGMLVATLSDALGIAMGLHNAGRLDEAGVLYRRILDAAPDHIQGLYLAGTLMCQQSRFDEARPFLEKAVALAPDLSGAHLNLGKILARSGDWTATARHCRRVLALAPADASAWELLGVSRRQIGQQGEAITALTRSHRIAPHGTEATEKLGLLLFERGRRHLDERRPGPALPDLEGAARLLPFDMDLGFALAVALTEVGRIADAITRLERLLAWSPAEIRVLRSLGLALPQVGRTDGGIRMLLRAAAVAPDDADPCEALASLLGERDPAQAVHWSTRALAIKLERSAGSAFGTRLPAADGSVAESGRTLDVVSFSLWGALEAYCGGAVENARSFPAAMPGWRCRFYHDDSVPPHILAELAGLGAELVAMPPETTARQGMFWRFLVSDDPLVRRFLCRDCDSRPTAREIAALREWIGSGVPFHAMRDHVMHMEPLMGGMWGGTAGLLASMRLEIDRFTAGTNSRWNDQHFLAELVWPQVASRVMVHDGVHPALGRPFPETACSADGHVGAKLLRLTRLPPTAGQEGLEEPAEGRGPHGLLSFPAHTPHIGRSLAALGEWLEIELALCAGFLAAGDLAVDLDAGFGAHALAFSRIVGDHGRVFAAEGSPGLFECLTRTVAANGLANLVARRAPDWVLTGEELGRIRLVRAVLAQRQGGLGEPLAGILARSRPVLYLRIEDDAGTAESVAQLLGHGYRLYWHIAPVFNPDNRSGCLSNPFPRLVSVNMVALPPGQAVPHRRLVGIGGPDASWEEASWQLICGGG